jgi:hypothetical protein
MATKVISAYITSISAQQILPSGASNGQSLLYNNATGLWNPGNVLTPPINPTTNQVVTWNGSAWIAANPPALNAAGVIRALVVFSGIKNVNGINDPSNTARLIRKSNNITNVIRIGTGSYQVNFATSMADTNYAAFCNATDITGVTNFSLLSIPYVSTKGLNNLIVSSRADAPQGTVNDKEDISIMVVS